MQHRDEGTIHAWLDGQLPREEAQSVEAHVAECRQCADLVAEARGLIAASSRILTALDGVPREVVPTQPSFRAEAEPVAQPAPGAAQPATPARAIERARRRWFSAPSLAAAAVIVVAIGTVTVMRAGRNRPELAADRIATVASAPGPSPDSAATPVMAPVPVAATPSAAPPAAEAEKTLGDRRSAATGLRVASVPAAAPADRDAGNEATRAAVDSTRERLDTPTRLAETRQLAGGAQPAAPSVARAKVEAQAASAESTRTADELKKDATERELAGRAAGAAVRGNVSVKAPVPDTSTVRLLRGRQAEADAAPPAKQVAVGSLRGRVTDANDTGIAGATVVVVGTNTGVVANAAGEYTLGGVPGGRQRINVRQIGYQPVTREVTVTVGQTQTADIVLSPAPTALSDVVVTAAPQPRRQPLGSAIAKTAPPPAPEVAPGAPITATQSNAVGCYELGITSTTPTRTGFRQIPRRIALDAEIVPANAGGIWYRARDLSRTNTVPNGLWRPTGPNAIEIEWTYGSRTGRIVVSGPAGSMMRGTVEEIDRAAATGDAGSVVAIRRPCDG